MTKKKLRQLYFLKREIRLLEEEIAEFKACSLVGSPILDHMPKTPQISDRTAKTALKQAEYLERLEALKARAENSRNEIIEYVVTIDDSYIRQIFFMRHIKLYSWGKIAYKLGGGNSADGIRMIHNRYLQKENPLLKGEGED